MIDPLTLTKKTDRVLPFPESFATQVLDSLPHPVLMIDADDRPVFSNLAAEAFFHSSASVLNRQTLSDLVPFGSPIFGLVQQVRTIDALVTEYKLDISSPKIGQQKTVDVYASPAAELEGGVVLMFQVRTMAEKIDRQLTHRGAARTVSGLAAMLAHEIKNPLSGIRGAAQLLEASAGQEDHVLTRLITDETDRIVKIVDRMEVFSDQRPIERSAVNIHSVLEHVRRISESGFGRGKKFIERYDPSLPPVFGNRDQLIQVFINLAKNAAEATDNLVGGEIQFSSAFRPGIRISAPGTKERISLPLEFCIRDNGPGIPEDLQAHIFDPFVTSKTTGSGLGLALVAKIIGDHGGVVECDSQPGETVFRILLPAYQEQSAGEG